MSRTDENFAGREKLGRKGLAAVAVSPANECTVTAAVVRECTGVVSFDTQLNNGTLLIKKKLLVSDVGENVDL